MAVVRFLAPDTDAFVASVQCHTADLKILSNNLYLSNRIHPFLEGEGAVEVYMSGPVFLGEHLAAG